MATFLIALASLSLLPAASAHARFTAAQRADVIESLSALLADPPSRTSFSAKRTTVTCGSGMARARRANCSSRRSKDRWSVASRVFPATSGT
jgi:hypothetical protein